jgi:flagellar biosynthetic protein FliQ
VSEELVIELLALTLQTTGLLVAPVLTSVVVVGIVVNILQTITQIRDPALAFIPKLVVAGLVLVITAAWSLQIMSSFCRNMMQLAGRGMF